jgi:hypothetical protein
MHNFVMRFGAWDDNEICMGIATTCDEFDDCEICAEVKYYESSDSTDFKHEKACI